MPWPLERDFPCAKPSLCNSAASLSKFELKTRPPSPTRRGRGADFLGAADGGKVTKQLSDCLAHQKFRSGRANAVLTLLTRLEANFHIFGLPLLNVRSQALRSLVQEKFFWEGGRGRQQAEAPKRGFCTLKFALKTRQSSIDLPNQFRTTGR